MKLINCLVLFVLIVSDICLQRQWSFHWKSHEASQTQTALQVSSSGALWVRADKGIFLKIRFLTSSGTILLLLVTISLLIFATSELSFFKDTMEMVSRKRDEESSNAASPVVLTKGQPSAAGGHLLLQVIALVPPLPSVSPKVFRSLSFKSFPRLRGNSPGIFLSRTFQIGQIIIEEKGSLWEETEETFNGRLVSTLSLIQGWYDGRVSRGNAAVLTQVGIN